MPLIKILRMMHLTVGLLALSLSLMVFMVLGLLRVAPADVYQEVRAVRSEIQINNQTMRELIGTNTAEITRLRREMKLRTDQLKEATERLKKLDPTYVPPILPPEE